MYTALERDGRGAVSRAVDDQDLTAHAGARQALFAPIHELADRYLFVQRRNDNAEERIGGTVVAGGAEEFDVL
jgi:hypothetical protein